MRAGRSRMRSALAPSRHPVRSFALIAFVPLLYTVAIAVVPEWRLTWFSPAASAVTTTSAVWLAAMAAATLRLPHDHLDSPTKRGFVAALLVLASVSALALLAFVLVPQLVSGSRVQVAAVYSWLTGRYVLGLLLVALALRPPRLSVRGWLAAILAVMGTTLVVYLLAAPWLPKPFAAGAEGAIVISDTVALNLVISAVPALLLSVGVVVAWRLFRLDSDTVYWWLSLALFMQVLAKVHEVLYPASLGPILTTADVLVVAMLVLLLAAAVQRMHRLTRHRAAALEAQSRDLRLQSQILAEMSRFTEREELFRSIVTHELATPLAAIRTYAHVLSKPGTSRVQAQWAAEGISDEAGRLMELVSRMDELRSLEAEEVAVSLRPVRLLPILQEVARFARALSGRHRVIASSGRISVLADPVRLGQALRNLVSNAISYSPDGSAVTITGHKTAAGVVAVTVADDGPGISSEERDRLLERYERGTPDVDVPGMGLGLYVARCIAQAHGGRLHVDRGDAVGTVAVIELEEAA